MFQLKKIEEAKNPAWLQFVKDEETYKCDFCQKTKFGTEIMFTCNVHVCEACATHMYNF